MPKPIPLRRRGADPRHLLERLLDTPDLARVVPQLRPEILHRVVQSCGLEDCGELLALATPGQLTALFDLDLWRSHRPGVDEQFDADRFGVWLEVLLEAGAAIAAAKLAATSLHSRVRAVNPSDVEFISENHQIVTIGEFMQSLPAILGR